MMSDQPDYFAVLHVAVNATLDDIKAAYKREAREWHPDRHQNDKHVAEERFKRIEKAYYILSDQYRREEYISTLPPWLVFEPHLVDFGDVRPGDPPKQV